MLVERYVVSLERFGSAYQYHILVEKMGKSFTLQVRTTSDSESKFFEDNVHNVASLVYFFKDKYDMDHMPIKFSYGPMLRKHLREKNNARRHR